MVVCSRIWFGLLAVSQADSCWRAATAGAAGAAGSSTPVGASSPSLLWSTASGLQVMMTHLLQKHWHWQEDRRPMMRHDSVRRPTMYLASTLHELWRIIMSMDGLLQPFYVRLQVWKDRPPSSVWRVNSLLPDAFAKGASKPPDFG